MGDENVNIDRLRPYFDKDAWLLINQVVRQVRLNPVWLCQVCRLNVEENCVL